MDADGSNAKQLTTNQVPEGNASLSPDGTTVLFTSGSNEQFDIYYNDKLFLVPAAGGAGARAAARRDLRGRERRVEQGRQEHLLHRQHGRAQRDHEGGRRHAAGDAAHQGRAQPAAAGRSPKTTACTCSCATPARGRARCSSMPAAGGEPKRVTRGVRRRPRQVQERARRGASRGRARTASRSRGCSITRSTTRRGRSIR